MMSRTTTSEPGTSTYTASQACPRRRAVGVRYGYCRHLGFTLVELLVVLAIIVVFVGLAVPRGKHSNQHLRLYQESLNIMAALDYCISLAESGDRVARFVLDTKQKSYHIEALAETDQTRFHRLPNHLGQPHYWSDDLIIIDETGFDGGADVQYLAFDPGRSWPIATVTLATGSSVVTIKIDGRQITSVPGD